MPKNLGRHLLIPPPKVDPRNRNYPARRLLGDPGTVPDQDRARRRYWRGGPVLDQGNTGDCTGFAMTGVLMADPKGDFSTPAAVANTYAHNHTQRSRLGLSGIAQTAVTRGAIDSYYWCENLGDAVDALIAVGPVQASLPWYDSMFSVVKDRVPVRITDAPGHHAFALTAYDPAKVLGGWTGPAFRIRNSWGKYWGGDGTAWITCADFERAMTGPHGNGYDQSVFLPWGKTGKPIAQLLTENPDPALS